MPEILSINKFKLYKKLLLKKYRDQYNLFLVEGWKACYTFIEHSVKYTEAVLITKDLDEEKKILLKSNLNRDQILFIDHKQMKQLSDEATPQGIILVAQKKKQDQQLDNISGDVIFLDRIKDPGNLGTILRTAFWFDIENVFLSPDCVDLYNPKTARASAGYICALNVKENITENELTHLKSKKGYTLYSTVVEKGIPLQTVIFSRPAIFLLGNEATGLDERLLELSDERVTIQGKSGAESLNIGISAAILMYHLNLKV